MKTKKILRILVLSTLTVVLLTAAGFGIYAGTINYPPLDTSLLNSTMLSVTVNDNNGTPISHPQDKYGAKIILSILPDHTKSAFLSAEDKRFYKHHGLDYRRMASAILKNTSTLSFKEGASTISQQLIKNTHLSAEKTIERKLKEANLTRKLEKNYTKDEIISMYLNCIYFGNGAYGLNSASRLYFGKNGSELTIAQSALLAGVINSPAKYNPWTNPDKAKERQKTVLKLMLKNKAITQSQYTDACSESIVLADSTDDTFRDYVSTALSSAQNILSYLGVKNLTGITIDTYLDQATQQALVESIQQYSEPTQNKHNTIPEHMGIVMDVINRGITAYTASNNVSYETKRQPASTLKPIAVYLPALESGIVTPATPVLDEPINYKGYRPQNYNNKHEGWLSIRQALKSSNNIIAVKLLEQLGIDTAKDYCSRTGLELSGADNSLSIALGGLSQGVRLVDLTNAYADLADTGLHGKPSMIKTITSASGTILYKHSPEKTRIVREDSAYLITDMLRDNAKSGTASRLKPLKHDVAAKTGTGGASGQLSQDAYCISYTSQNAVGIWMGSKDNSDGNSLSSSVTGGTYPTMITKSIYEKVYNEENVPPKFTMPDSVLVAEIDKNRYNTDKLVVIAEEDVPPAFRQREVFSRYHPPSRLIGENTSDTSQQKAPPAGDAARPNQDIEKKRKSFINRIKRFFGGKNIVSSPLPD